MQEITPALSKHFSLVGWTAGLLLFASGQLYGQAAAPNALPPGDGKDLLAAVCTQCHSLKPILMLRDGQAGWKALVGDMVLRGAQLLPSEADSVVQYLTKNFGPGSSPMQFGAPSEKTAPGQTGGADRIKAESLPDGAGKELVESRCTLCHDLGIVTTLRRNKDGWDRIVKDMMARGVAATPAEIQTMISYLTSQFGEQGK